MARSAQPKGGGSGDDPLAEVGRELLHNDPELKALAKDVYRQAMQSMLRDLKAGTHAVKLPIYRLLLPSIIKEAGKGDGEESPAVVADALFKELRETVVRGGIGTGVPAQYNTPAPEGEGDE